ncbi:hypothetical protein L3Q82_004700 [Scortum barcoo]|uniref:Uncharacterized protein n=1 Tax=Scortum barcoo TaxID=214431 RepID=A0ACB8VGW7_9TELE|nr:hypothetical protein L3Q82_004700 [Scortum barcoo]
MIERAMFSHGKQVLGDEARLRAVHKPIMNSRPTRTVTSPGLALAVTGAPPWSQAWVWGSQASACSGPQDLAGLSPKWQHGPAFQ